MCSLDIERLEKRRPKGEQVKHSRLFFAFVLILRIKVPEQGMIHSVFVFLKRIFENKCIESLNITYRTIINIY